MTLAVLTATVLALPGRAQDAPEPTGSEAAQEQAEGASEAAESLPETAGSAPEAAETTPDAASPPAAAGEAAADGPVVLDEEEGSVLDDQTFEGEDDDFIPTEQIPIDQAIPFPTDI